MIFGFGAAFAAGFGLGLGFGAAFIAGFGAVLGTGFRVTGAGLDAGTGLDVGAGGTGLGPGGGFGADLRLVWAALRAACEVVLTGGD